MKIVPICNNTLTFTVSDEDYERVMQHKWYLSGGSYVNATRTYITGIIDGKTTQVGRFILGLTDPKLQCDHIDKNYRNNERSNLRVATPQENSCNQEKRNGMSSKYLGVCWDSSRKQWMANAKFGGKNVFIGRYNNEEEAARARDRRVKKLYGEFAQLNFLE